MSEASATLIQAGSLSGAAASGARTRDASLDALKLALVVLVLFHHSAITYGASGSWYYKEILPSGSHASGLMSLFTAVNQAFFMGLFFLIAGYFTPAAVARHGAAAYLRERALRLGLPLIVYGFVLAPVTIALAATARGLDFTATLLRLWSRATFEAGPLWFAEALLIFGVAYVVVRRFRTPGPPPPFPSNAVLFGAALATGAAAFALRLVWPAGWAFLALQFGFFASYVVLFAAGCAAASWPSLDQAPEAQRAFWGRVAWIAFLILPLTAILYPWLTGVAPEFGGGWSFPALVYAFWEPFVAWGIILALLHAFSQRFATLGPLGRTVARRAYTVYIIHPPILVAIALAWRTVPAPALIKFLLTGSATVVACWAIAGLLLRVPGARRVL